MAVDAHSRHVDPGALRAEARAGRFAGTSAGHCPGFAQANLVVLPRSLAFDFLVFAQRNPKPCPVLEVLDPGDPEPRLTAPGADVRTDPSGVPRLPRRVAGRRSRRPDRRVA